jgi:replicative DNA helicase
MVANVELNRIPPYNVEAERAVLGAALLDAGAYVLASAIVEPEHFYVEAHRRIWMAMARLTDRREALDNLTVGNELRACGDLEKIGGAMALDGLTDAVATVAHAEHYADIVRSLAARRAMIYAAQQVVADGFSEALDSEEYLANAREALARADRILQGRHRSESIGRVAHRVLDGMEKRTGNLDMVDLGIGGIRIPKGLLTVVAGRPSNGKSVWAMNAACNVAQAGGKVLVFTLEDTKETFAARAASRYSGVSLTSIMDREVDVADWPRMMQGFSRVSELPIEINDRTRASSRWMRQTAALHQQQNGLDLVVIDYVQLMREPSTNSRQEEISEATLGAVEMARELHVAEILVSQIKRPEYQYKDKVPPPPTIDMLKGSGTLEESARVAILLHYPRQYDEDEEPGHLWCRIAKHSNGKVGRRDLACNLDHMWVGDPGMDGSDLTAERY